MMNSPSKLLDQRLNEQREYFVAELKETEERLMIQFSTICADISNIRGDVKLLATKVKSLIKTNESIAEDVEGLLARVNVLENDKVSADLILFNIPNNVDALVAAEKLTSALKCEHMKTKSAFRTRALANSDKPVPIICKLPSAADRVDVFRALAQFKKSNKHGLRLSDIGLSGVSNINVHECLSLGNKELLNNALRYKKSNLLHAIFTLRGLVFVKKSAESKAVKISNSVSLSKVVGGP